MPTTPPLRHARIAAILSLVSRTLLLLRNNHIPLYQSSNFVQSPLNHPGSRTILFSITVYLLLFIVAGTGATDISLSNCSFILLEVLFIICKDPSLSDNASILSVLYELILFFLWSMPYVFHFLSGGNFA